MPPAARFCKNGHDTAEVGRRGGNCIPCHRAICAAKSHERHIKNLYGITIADYNRMFSEQNGMCQICHTHQSALQRKLNVDHNHTTGKVRGLLCSNCNVAIGSAKERPDILRNMAQYLEATNG